MRTSNREITVNDAKINALKAQRKSLQISLKQLNRTDIEQPVWLWHEETRDIESELNELKQLIHEVENEIVSIEMGERDLEQLAEQRAEFFMESRFAGVSQDDMWDNYDTMFHTSFQEEMFQESIHEQARYTDYDGNYNGPHYGHCKTCGNYIDMEEAAEVCGEFVCFNCYETIRWFGLWFAQFTLATVDDNELKQQLWFTNYCDHTLVWTNERYWIHHLDTEKLFTCSKCSRSFQEVDGQLEEF